MRIHEPMTLATDYLLAALVFYFGLRLLAHWRRIGEASGYWWSIGFFASAAAALAGGTYHGLLPYLSPLAAFLLWKFTVFAIGLAALFLFTGAVMATLAGPPRKFLLVLAGLKFLVYSIWMTAHDDFRYVIYDYAPALVGICLLAVYAGLARKAPFAGWLIGGVLVCFAAAGIQMSGLALHAQFNHNDLYHVMQMGAFWLFYRGGLLLRDR